MTVALEASHPHRAALRKQGAQLGLPVAGVALFFGLWQYLSVGPLAESNLPYASGTLIALGDIVQSSAFYKSLQETLLQAGLGFALSVAIGLPLGLLVGLSEVFFRATRVVLEVFKAIPAIVILPLVVLQIGTSRSMSVVLIVFTLVPLLIVTTASGARDTDPLKLEAARSYRMSRWARTRRIVLPSALPFIATGLRISVAFALVVAVVAGIVGGAPGLGHDVETYRQAGLLETVFGYIIVLGLLGIAVNVALVAIERRAIHWHESVRNQRGSGTSRSDPRGAGPVRAGLQAMTDRIAAAVEPVGLRFASAIRSARPAARPHSGGRRRMPGGVRRWMLRALQIAVPVALLAAWWYGSRSSTDPFFPPAATIWERFKAVWVFDHFAEDAVPSLRNLVLGFAIAVVVGISAGIVIGQVRWLASMLDPIISFFRSVPAIAYLPLLIAVVGFNSPMRITAIALAALFPVLIATTDGMRSVDETLLDVSRCYRLSRFRRLLSVQLPSAGPRIFAGLEISLAAALIVMVASELLGTSNGIGSQVVIAQQNFNFADMWAGILLLAVIGLVSNVLFRIAHHYVLAWYDGLRAAARAQ